MLDINDLEKRWLHYKIKSYLPHAIIVTSLTVIIFIFSFVFLSDSQKDVTTEQKNIVKVQEKTTNISPTPVIEKVIVKEKIVQVPTKQEEVLPESTLKLEPSLGFMKKMQSSTQPYYNNNNPIITQNTDSYRAPVKVKKQAVKEEVIEQKVEVVSNEVVEETKKISIKRRNTKDDIAEIIKRFKKNNNPALSLFVAKKYYELGDYHQAYNYALITNNINSDIEQSWIIFAKSLVKLNEKEMAIKTLNSYIKSSHSNTAQILLEEITSGKFR